MAENEKIERVKEKLKANKGRIIVVGGIAATCLAISMLRVHEHNISVSNTGTTSGVRTDATKTVNANYQKVLQKDDNKHYNDALKATKNGQAASALPSLVAHDSPPPNDSKLNFDDEVGINTKPAPLPPPPKKKDEPPKQKEAPDIDLPLPKTKTITPPPKQSFQQIQQPLQQPQLQNAEEHEDQEMQFEEALIKKVDNANSINIGYGFKSSAQSSSNGYSNDSNENKNKWNAGSAESLANAKTNSNNGSEQNATNFVMPAPGTVMDAQMVSQVTSYSNGPVFALITSGKYEGARIIGSFSENQNQNGLQLIFNTMTIPYEDEDGNTQTQTVNINAIGVSQGTMGNSVATSVNRHFLLRASYQLATSFMQGLGQAIQQSGSTATTTSGGNTIISQGKRNMQQQLMQAGGQAAENMNQQMQQFLQPYMQAEVRIEQGTPFEIVFMNGNR